MTKSGLFFFILKFYQPLQSCCCPVQKNLPQKAELAWQVPSMNQNKGAKRLQNDPKNSEIICTTLHSQTALKLSHFIIVMDIVTIILLKNQNSSNIRTKETLSGLFYLGGQIQGVYLINVLSRCLIFKHEDHQFQKSANFHHFDPCPPQSAIFLLILDPSPLKLPTS